MEIAVDGGAKGQAEPDKDAQGVLYVTAGSLQLTLKEDHHELRVGSYVYLPPGTAWTLENLGDAPAHLHWIRKRYEAAPDLAPPEPFVTREADAQTVDMPDTDGRWSTTRFVDPNDLRHDMHVNIVTFEPGGTIPFEETHVMEHGLFVLEGKAVYKLNTDWIEVEAGDFMWLRAFCPQACYAGGPGRFRYLLYKDVNRHPRLSL
jgi:(S)-ureidoglycine aminohydrolase